MSAYIYIITNQKNGTLYIGMTNDLVRRTYEHQEGLVKGFSKKYGLNKLVYFEAIDSIDAAIKREKQLKKWERAWKIKLIESVNPHWQDLYQTIAN
ncbi:MAG: GIY-YIG nuclease family protein [Dongiaceae bacterium]